MSGILSEGASVLKLKPYLLTSDARLQPPFLTKVRKGELSLHLTGVITKHRNPKYVAIPFVCLEW